MNTEQAILSDLPVSEALAPGSKLLSGQYEIIRYLSSGGFGITYLARDSLNRQVVIKECFPEAFCSRVNRTVRARSQNYVTDFRSIVRLFVREAHALSKLDHPGVVGVHQVFEDNETAYMALDLVDGKDLLEIIESRDPVLSPPQIHKLTLALLDAVAHVHSQDLLHRDISPDNILLDKAGQPVLIDFGAAREEASRKSRVLSAVLVVKDGYSPQEFYVAGSQQFPCSDLYALAATLVHLITGEAPPNSQARLSALAANQPDLYIPLNGRFRGYDSAFLEAIDRVMNIVPSERLQSADEWLLMIDHSKRAELARARAAQDKSIDQTVMRLVRYTNSQPILAQNVCSPKQQSASQERQDVPLKTRKKIEDLTPDLPVADMACESALSEDQPMTPYVRVTSKAIAAKEKKMNWRQRRALRGKPRMSRFATVPVVFCAYYFYAHIVLQNDAVHAATVGPILTFGTELSEMRQPAPSIADSRGGTN